jgi:hypothetical protein
VHGRVVEQQVAGHQHELALLGDGDEFLRLGGTHRRRLLDEDVLARLQCLLRQRVMRRDRGREDDTVEVGVRENFGEVGRRARVRVAVGEPPAQVVIEIAEPGELAKLVEVPREVRPPVTETDDRDPAHSFHTLPSSSQPLVALRKSTMTFPRRTTSA